MLAQHLADRTEGSITRTMVFKGYKGCPLRTGKQRHDDLLRCTRTLCPHRGLSRAFEGGSLRSVIPSWRIHSLTGAEAVVCQLP